MDFTSGSAPPAIHQASPAAQQRSPRGANPESPGPAPARQPRQDRPPREVIRTPLPDITFPEDLPVSGRRADIAKAILENQVIIVSGETGSGKTTQLPKICLELGRGAKAL
ncbi:MAG: hypothetical protein WKG03_01115, partial [Telluria sp.]